MGGRMDYNYGIRDSKDWRWFEEDIPNSYGSMLRR
jgi:hypothetical protein